MPKKSKKKATPSPQILPKANAMAPQYPAVDELLEDSDGEFSVIERTAFIDVGDGCFMVKRRPSCE